MSMIISSITGDILLKTIVNITTSIMTTNNLFTWFINHKNNDYNIYKKKIISTDLPNKLIIISSLIKDIIKKNYVKTEDSIDNIIQQFLKDGIITTNNEDYTIIDYDLKLNIFINIPDPFKLSLLSTLEIINIINIELNNINTKIKKHQKSYLSFFYSVKIENEILNIYEYSQIFEKRIDLLFKIISACNK
jgi:hypothetical protein